MASSQEIVENEGRHTMDGFGAAGIVSNITKRRMESNSTGTIHSLQLVCAVLQLGNAIKADLGLIFVDVRGDPIYGFIVVARGAWRISADDKQLLVGGAAEPAPDGSADGEALVELDPMQSCGAWQGAKGRGKIRTRPCLDIFVCQGRSCLMEVGHCGD